ncbi:hypothetical protein [Paenibacillus sp. GCM10012306]|uniref:hypothetical protein n=1 Tax=Paenibacillus sp. GCM10012306 TaxID=3317342 RepID=UPI003617958A
MQIGRRLYYELATGNIIQDTGERSGDVVETTQEQDFAAYRALAERTPETVGVLELEYGEYREDFARSNGYRFNLKTLEIEFSYPDPNETEQPQEPVYEKPLSVQVADLSLDLAMTQVALAEAYEELLSSRTETTSLQLALVDVYEQLLEIKA